MIPSAYNSGRISLVKCMRQQTESLTLVVLTSKSTSWICFIEQRQWNYHLANHLVLWARRKYKLTLQKKVRSTSKENEIRPQRKGSSNLKGELKSQRKVVSKENDLRPQRKVSSTLNKCKLKPQKKVRSFFKESEHKPRVKVKSSRKGQWAQA